jgi:F0F1-type ATP synthase delta subunit
MDARATSVPLRRATSSRTAAAKAVELHEEVNPDLIGGLVVRVGDKQIDTSVAQALRTLDRSFQKNLYIADF